MYPARPTFGVASRFRARANAEVLADSPDASSTERWRIVLTEGHAPLVRAREVLRHLPSAPRCKVCNNPFGGVGGRVLSVAGFRPSRKNPTICSRCCDGLPAGGAEVDIAVLFADVRGSTALGERCPPREFAWLLNRFYAAVTEVLLRHGAVIDKLIGDEVMAFFVAGIAGPQYRAAAIRAGLDLMRAVGYENSEGPWIEIGASINAGTAYVGNVGAAVVDFTALGEPVNTAAGMQRVAASGELLVRTGIGDELIAGSPQRTLRLPGRERPLDALVVTV